MKTKVNISGVKKRSDFTVQVGQYYVDNSEVGNGSIYIVAELSTDEFGLVGLHDGLDYMGEGHSNLEDIFGTDKGDFELIEKIDIKIS